MSTLNVSLPARCRGRGRVLQKEEADSNGIPIFELAMLHLDDRSGYIAMGTIITGRTLHGASLWYLLWHPTSSDIAARGRRPQGRSASQTARELGRAGQEGVCKEEGTGSQWIAHRGKG